MRSARLAGFVLAGLFAALLAVETWLLVRLREAAEGFAGSEATPAASIATQLVLAQQSLQLALSEHRQGAPEFAVRQSYEQFAARLEQMQNAARAPALARLPGLEQTLLSAASLTSRIDLQVEALPSEQMAPNAIEALRRDVPQLREPLAQLLGSVWAAQQLADADLAERAVQLREMLGIALAGLLAAALVACGTGAIAWRQMRRARLLRVRQEARAQELRGEVAQAMRGRLDALAFVAAETNARIAAVTGSLADALEQANIDQRTRDALLGLRTQTDDLLVLAIDLADLARLEAGEIRLRPAPFRLSDAMQQAADLLRHRFRSETVTVDVAEPSAMPPWWLGDAARVRQLLQHLGSAVAELRQHGHVLLSAERLAADSSVAADLPERLVLAAAITPGPSALPSEPRPEPPAEHSLSLTLVRTLSIAMGGRLDRRNAPDGSCTLQVTLTLSACAEPAGAGSGVVTQAVFPLDILVVDDVVLNRRLLAAVLERFGHRCEMATDGLEALRAVQQRRFDVVLMDIQMPNLDGIAATRMLRALPPPAGLVPVIAVTAAGEAEDRAAYAAAGMDGFVQKPVATDELMGAIAAVARGRAREPAIERDGLPELAVGPLMDTQSLAILRSTLAADELARLVDTTEEEATQALRGAEAASARGDAAALSAAALALVQACEGVGALRVVAIARALHDAANDGTVARAAAHLPALRRALGETLAAISRRGPGAPPPRTPGDVAKPALVAGQHRS
ncbi:MAG: response regulator [Acetobacteraceae bacterium]|nr:response regulator [Acetobacteraceae bacterium]